MNMKYEVEEHINKGCLVHFSDQCELKWNQNDSSSADKKFSSVSVWHNDQFVN